MIICINGAFGVGKTTVAELLAQKMPRSMVFDPEEIGVSLQKILSPIDAPDNFQHYPLWRSLTIATAKGLRNSYDRDLIIPMTIWREKYFREIMDGLQKIDIVHHFTLTATLKTILKRLETRGEQKPGSWPYKQSELAVPMLKSPLFKTHIDAEETAPKDIVEIILKQISIMQ